MSIRIIGDKVGLQLKETSKSNDIYKTRQIVLLSFSLWVKNLFNNSNISYGDQIREEVSKSLCDDECRVAASSKTHIWMIWT